MTDTCSRGGPSETRAGALGGTILPELRVAQVDHVGDDANHATGAYCFLEGSIAQRSWRLGLWSFLTTPT